MESNNLSSAGANNNSSHGVDDDSVTRSNNHAEAVATATSTTNNDDAGINTTTATAATEPIRIVAHPYNKATQKKKADDQKSADKVRNTIQKYTRGSNAGTGATNSKCQKSTCK